MTAHLFPVVADARIIHISLNPGYRNQPTVVQPHNTTLSKRAATNHGLSTVRWKHVTTSDTGENTAVSIRTSESVHCFIHNVQVHTMVLDICVAMSIIVKFFGAR